jgi:phosphoglycolate phosphatase-like HAD superfamily hydrolase
MRPTVFLFDIDGTLISTGGAGRRAMVGAFTRRHARPDVCDFPFGGMTDRAIVRTGIAALGHEPDEAAIDQLIGDYLALLEVELLRAEGARVHAGVHETLDHLAPLPGAAIGLGTGNVIEGARHKLRHLGLDHRFAFGGYGSDHEGRPELLQIGADRGAARLGLPRSACRVVVIGDTPRDIAAARAIGAVCLAVATGNFPLDELRSHHPDLALPDLTPPEARRLLVDEPA